jgi:predicted ArsR family transcriptional regulator
MTRPGERAWKENKTTVERVWSVVFAVSGPRSAEDMADEATVSVETARNHLDSLGLVELTAVLERNQGVIQLFTRY